MFFCKENVVSNDLSLVSSACHCSCEAEEQSLIKQFQTFVCTQACQMDVCDVKFKSAAKIKKIKKLRYLCQFYQYLCLVLVKLHNYSLVSALYFTQLYDI